ncbi:MAG: RNA polymerase sigma factor [Planctomycetota bacterium]
MANNASKQDCPEFREKPVYPDHQAFADLVDKYKDSIFLCCRTLGLKHHEADDIASETFLAAFKAMHKYRGEAKLGTWLWKIAYCKAISYLRKNNRRAELLGKFANKLPDSRKQQNPAELESKELNETIWQGVNQLPRLWAMAVILYYREEKSISDIAKIMRIRQNTVKTYLFRARKKLKETLTAVLGEDIDVNW